MTQCPCRMGFINADWRVVAEVSCFMLREVQFPIPHFISKRASGADVPSPGFLFPVKE